MKLTACLVNAPWEDPALLLVPDSQSWLWLVDCGDVLKMRIRDMQRVSHVFITHTHIDHFIGLDWLIRMNLRESVTLTVYGPGGIIDQVRCKLAAYAWNYTADSSFAVDCYELSEETVKYAHFACSDKFAPNLVSSTPRPEFLLLPCDVQLKYAHVQHGVPCLAYSFTCPREITVSKPDLQKAGLAPGRWVRELVEHAQKQELTGVICLAGRDYSLESLAEDLLVYSPGPSYSYITDTLFNKVTVRIMENIAANCQQLWCEACYLHNKLPLARQNQHFTARQAGRLAQSLKAEELCLMHYSRRYKGNLMDHILEAREVFPNTKEPQQY